MSLGLVGLCLWAIYARVGLAVSMTWSDWAQMIQMLLRIVVLAMLAALVGAALRSLLKRAAVVVGVALAAVTLEQLLSSRTLIGLQPFLIITNVRGWIENGTYYYVDTCDSALADPMCGYAERSIGFSHSAVALLALAAVVTTAAAIAFRRRSRRTHAKPAGSPIQRSR